MHAGSLAQKKPMPHKEGFISRDQEGSFTHENGKGGPLEQERSLSHEEEAESPHHDDHEMSASHANASVDGSSEETALGQSILHNPDSMVVDDTLGGTSSELLVPDEALSVENYAGGDKVEYNTSVVTPVKAGVSCWWYIHSTRFLYGFCVYSCQ